jgi:hypothetical protein
MKKKAILLTLCLFFSMVVNAFSAYKITIRYPFAFRDRFQASSQQLGFPEGNVLQLGCFIEPADSPIKEVTIKNLDTGLILTATPANLDVIMSGLYYVQPMPPFDSEKHMGVWEIMVKDEKGNEATAKTHKMDINGEMPYVEGLKASGDPLAPVITWSPPKNIPEGIQVRYRVRLLKDANNQFYISSDIFDTTYKIPQSLIKSDDLSNIYIRIECRGFDKNDFHSVPIEFQSETFMHLKEALGK